ncbi:MAG: polyphosphate polymerase domain-containing protein [Lewinellaceae bacterium]|nr:polyphosphate polymerase domain-containing protein [Saprospiraceae bacterium]MCB9340068.1 polyphosphate polymerase domain-containing protein [Lewinellaceae bacterium]
MLRYEYKYLVPISMLDQLRGLLRPFTELDRHAAENGGEYTVRSIYFDTQDLECYFMKLAGVKRRNKVRLRGYNLEADGNPVFFEIKKKVDEPLFKNRAAMSFEAARSILRGEPLEDFVQPSRKLPEAVNNARRFMYHIHARNMRPVVAVIYEREPYQGLFKDRDNNLRITFDKNLRGVAHPALDDLFEEQYAHPVDNRHFILEVKFNLYLPGWVKAITASLNLKKGPASKYVMCIESNPEILSGKGQVISSSRQMTG